MNMDRGSERIIRQFPLAYNSDASPYRQFRFDGDVREYVDREIQQAKSHLRVAKCIFVGDIAVGKTCLINRFGYNVFTNNYKATIGVDFDVQKFTILDRPFNLQIWDTAGQERFKCIASTYYRGAHVAVIVFDMSNVASLSSSGKWLEDVMSSNQGPSKPLIFLVGCKKELLCESAFKFVEKEGIRVANELNAEFWTVSSSTGENVTEFFTRVSTLTFQEMIHREISLSNSLSNKLPVNYSTKFIKLRRDKSCKRFFSFSCSRL